MQGDQHLHAQRFLEVGLEAGELNIAAHRWLPA
jgi:hypothetical protein